MHWSCIPHWSVEQLVEPCFHVTRYFTELRLVIVLTIIEMRQANNMRRVRYVRECVCVKHVYSSRVWFFDPGITSDKT